MIVGISHCLVNMMILKSRNQGAHRRMVEDISALGLRHVGYAIPTEPGYFFGQPGWVMSNIVKVEPSRDGDIVGIKVDKRWLVHVFSRVFSTRSYMI